MNNLTKIIYLRLMVQALSDAGSNVWFFAEPKILKMDPDVLEHTLSHRVLFISRKERK